MCRRATYFCHGGGVRKGERESCTIRVVARPSQHSPSLLRPTSISLGPESAVVFIRAVNLRTAVAGDFFVQIRRRITLLTCATAPFVPLRYLCPSLSVPPHCSSTFWAPRASNSLSLTHTLISPTTLQWVPVCHHHIRG